MEPHNSHKQITKRILKNFMHIRIVECNGHDTKLKYVYYLNLNNYCYNYEKIKDFGTDVNYFDDETETFLSTTFEKGFSEVLNKIDKKDFSINDLDKNDYGSVINFCMCSFYRSKFVLNTILSNKNVQRMGIGTRSEVILKLTMENNIFSNDLIELVINKTNIDFIAPLNCVTTIKSNNGTTYFIPATPKIGFKIFSKLKDDRGLKEFKELVISDEQTIDYYNLATIDVENRNEKLVVAKDYKTFYRLGKIINKTISLKEEDA